MELGKKTRLATRRWIPLLGACIALMLLGAQWGVGAPPQGTDKNEQAKAPNKHDLTYSIQNSGSSVVLKSELLLKKKGTVKFHNQTGKKVTLSYASDVFAEVEHLDAEGNAMNLTGDSKGSTTLNPNETSTLEVKKDAATGTHSKINYKIDDDDIGSTGGADPIIIVRD